MHQAIIHIDPTGPSAIGFAQAAGMPGDVQFDFRTQGNQPYPGASGLYPQLVLRPFTRPEIHAYDIVMDDKDEWLGVATVPGVVMNDRFNAEVYQRNEIDGAPQRMLAYGRIDLNGYGYMRSGPLGPASYPTGPAGPAGMKGETGPEGPQGDPGLRGSRWYTGSGAPSASNPPGERVEGDMYLDEMTADVWRWSGGAWRGYVKA